MALYHSGSQCQPQVSIKCSQLNRSSLIFHRGTWVSLTWALYHRPRLHQSTGEQVGRLAASQQHDCLFPLQFLCAEGGKVPARAPWSCSAQRPCRQGTHSCALGIISSSYRDQLIRWKSHLTTVQESARWTGSQKQTRACPRSTASELPLVKQCT